jgi:hypothetical protein
MEALVSSQTLVIIYQTGGVMSIKTVVLIPLLGTSHLGTHRLCLFVETTIFVFGKSHFSLVGF